MTLSEYEALLRLDDLGLGLHAPSPGGAFNRFAWLEFLVDLEEMLYFESVEFGHVVDVTDVLLAGVVKRHADHFVIAARFVSHAEHSDGTAPDDTAGERGIFKENEGVEWVTIEAQCVVDEPVIMRVTG